RRRASRDFTNLVRVEVRSNGDQVRIAGTTIGSEPRNWLVSALGFELELELAPLMVFFRYDDVPGVIGRVGTLFGDAGVNIANMTVSRTRRGDKALMALSIDSPAPPEPVVAYDLGARYAPGCNAVYTWNVNTNGGSIVSGKGTCGADESSTGGGVTEIGVAGTRLAWIVNEGGNTESDDDLFTATLPRP